MPLEDVGRQTYSEKMSERVKEKKRWRILGNQNEAIQRIRRVCVGGGNWAHKFCNHLGSLAVSRAPTDLQPDIYWEKLVEQMDGVVLEALQCPSDASLAAVAAENSVYILRNDSVIFTTPKESSPDITSVIHDDLSPTPTPFFLYISPSKTKKVREIKVVFSCKSSINYLNKIIWDWK